MKIIILSAGQGRRMLPLTKDLPKCLLKVQGKPVLLHQIETLRSAFRKLNKEVDIVVVTGYKTEVIERFVMDNNLDVNITYNPFYAVADNFYSLWKARHEMDDEILIINGDDLFTEEVIVDLINHPSSFCTVISVKEIYDSDDMKIKMNENQVTIIDKSIPDPDGENAGIIKLGKEEAKGLRKVLFDGSKDPSYLNVYWLKAINDLTKVGYSLNVLEVDRDDWAEIDFHPDIENIQKSWKVK